MNYSYYITGFPALLVLLAIALIPAIISGTMCKRLAAKKGLAHTYFWTGFFTGLLGLVYIGFQPDENRVRDIAP